jgi:hypothetical protein
MSRNAIRIPSTHWNWLKKKFYWSGKSDSCHADRKGLIRIQIRCHGVGTSILYTRKPNSPNGKGMFELGGSRFEGVVNLWRSASFFVEERDDQIVGSWRTKWEEWERIDVDTLTSGSTSLAEQGLTK